MKEEETVTVVELPLEARIEIGATLRLNVGPPQETIKSPEGKPAMMIRDDLGLLIDPKLYAKRRCSTCGGNGVFRVSNALKLIPSKVKGKYKNNMQTEIRTCGCVRNNYGKARTKLGRAFQEALRSQA